MYFSIQDDDRWLTWDIRAAVSGPVRAEVEVERDELNSNIGSQLTYDRVDTHERAGRHQDSIVVAPRDAWWMVIEASGKALDDVQHLVGLEVGGRGFAAQPPFGPELSIEILEERRRCSNRVRPIGHASYA